MPIASTNPLPLTPEDQGTIARFKAAASDFTGIHRALQNKRSLVAQMSPSDRQRYNDLMQRAVVIKRAISRAKAAIDGIANAYGSVKNWLRRTFGLDGLPLERAANQKMRQDYQLGALPVVLGAIALATTGIALITKWIADARTELNRFNQMERLQNDYNKTPEQAAQIVNQVAGESGGFFSGTLKRFIVPVAVIGGLAIVLPMLQDKS